MDYAKILTLDAFSSLIRPWLGRKLVCTSGGFDPIHPGHATCIVESSKLGGALVVIVNGDGFLKAKKGKAFQDVMTRCNIVSCIRGVDFVVPFDAEPGDQTVCKALEAIRPHVFTKGGDRTDYSNIPEWETCKAIGCEIVPCVGLSKAWSSSDFLREWGEFYASRLGAPPAASPSE